jgi:apolipoprotein N-acyltransferase
MQVAIESPEGATSQQPIAQTSSSQSAPTVRWRYLGLAVASGLLLWLCYFPVAWGFLGWIALIPLLPLIGAQMTGRWRYFCAWTCGVVFFFSAISWMTVADNKMIAAWAGLSTYCALYVPFAIYLVRRLERATSMPLVVTFPVVWTALEYLRSFLGTGFAWYLLGHTQHDALAVVQIADLGGAFLVGFLVAAVNVVCFEALARLHVVRTWLRLAESGPECCGRALALQAGILAAMLGATLAYGFWRLGEDNSVPGPRIALLQANLDQRLKNLAMRSPEAMAKVRSAYFDLCMQAAKFDPRPDIIVWPETSCPDSWVEADPAFARARTDPKIQRDVKIEQDPLRWIGILGKTNVLLGLNTYIIGDDEKFTGHFNSALLIDKDGRDLARYDKIHRVPFGEYVPMRDWLPFMNWFAPYDFNYSIGQGDSLTRLTTAKNTFGVLVCFEDTDPFMARNYGRQTQDGPAVDFLLNISNDGWFDGTSEHEEHLAISRFRAIESRRALARAVNMGISATIDSRGRVLAPGQTLPGKIGEIWTIPDDPAMRRQLPTAEWKNFKKNDGILVVQMPIEQGCTVYSQWGDALPTGCWVMVGGGLAWGWRRRKAASRGA